MNLNKLGKNSLIKYDGVNSIFVGISPYNSTHIDIKQLDEKIIQINCDANLVDDIIFDTNLLATNKYFVINDIYIAYIPNEKSYLTKDLKRQFNIPFVYNKLNGTYITNSTIDFKNVETVKVASDYEIYKLVYYFLKRNEIFKYKNEYYIYKGYKISSNIYKLFNTNDKYTYYGLNIKSLKDKDLNINDIELIYYDKELNSAKYLYNINLLINKDVYDNNFIPQCLKIYKVRFKSIDGYEHEELFKTMHNDTIVLKNNIHCLACDYYRFPHDCIPSLYIPLKNITYIEEITIEQLKGRNKKTTYNTLNNVNEWITGETYLLYKDTEHNKEYLCVFQGFANEECTKAYIYGIIDNDYYFLETPIVDIKDLSTIDTVDEDKISTYRMLSTIILKNNGMKYDKKLLPKKNTFYKVKYQYFNPYRQEQENIIVIDVKSLNAKYLCYTSIFDTKNNMYTIEDGFLAHLSNIISIKELPNLTNEFIKKETEKPILNADDLIKMKNHVDDYKKTHFKPYDYIQYRHKDNTSCNIAQYLHEDGKFIYLTNGGYIEKQYYNVKLYIK